MYGPASTPGLCVVFNPPSAGYTRTMGQQSDFDLDRFEQRVNDLLVAYEHLLAEHRGLQAAHQAQNEHNAQLRERLNSVIERIRALEAEADSV